MRDVLAALAREPGVAGAHLLVADAQASAIETVERKARGTATLVPRWIVLVEGWGDVETFTARARTFAADASLAAAAPAWAVYRLQNARCRGS